jgi:hypothetical protein
MVEGPVEVAAPPAERRTRERRQFRSLDRTAIANRVIEFMDADMQARSQDEENRLQRYAKYRQWTEGKSWPWEDASDQAIPDLVTSSLRVQDTLHNAVMSTRPSVVSRALVPTNDKKQETIDRLLDTQFFVEQPGERTLEEVIENFTNDGVVTAFVPWVRETRDMEIVRTFDAMRSGVSVIDTFRQLLEQTFPQERYRALTEEAWDWEVTRPDGEIRSVGFYTRKDGEIEMVINHTVEVHDGPKVIVKDYEDVLHPPRAANLQIPGPSNPNGAAHVILIDHPTLDELQRLQKQGVYNMLKPEELKALESTVRDTAAESPKRQKDTMEGSTEQRQDKKAVQQRTFTRLMCFDMHDIDGDGIAEDVVWWVLREQKLLMRAKPLGEVFPGVPPRRPLCEGQFLPIKGRRIGIGLLELQEGIHDFLKQITDQLVDGGTLSLLPFGFYRAASNIKPEVMRMWPGDLHPLNDPKNDVYFPTIGNPQATAYAFNAMTMADQWSEKLTMVTDLSLGRIPAGKSSALRTMGGIQTVLAQGEARPERILRRFFIFLTDVWKQMHRLNQHFLTQEKKFRVMGYMQPGEEPYREIKDPAEIAGDFQFDFGANVMNSSKAALQEGLQQLMAMYISPVAIQAGIVNAETIYRLLRDFGNAVGQNPDAYLTPPRPGSQEPPILAEEAISMIMSGEMPIGQPLEGAVMHLQKLQEFAQSENFGLLKAPEETQLFRQYFEEVQRQAQREQRMAELAQASQMTGGNGQAGPAGAPKRGQPQAVLQENELVDESLPSAGGGANQGG